MRLRFPTRLLYWSKYAVSGFAHIDHRCVQAFLENPLGWGGMRQLHTPSERMHEANVARAVRLTKGICPECVARRQAGDYVS